MDNNFTQKIQDWLNTDSNKRDYEQGALFLLQLSNNRIMYRNIMRNAKAKAEFIEYQLKKYLNFRLKELTRQQVDEMQTKVDKIVVSHNLSAENKTTVSSAKSGKRSDHDTLPDAVQALYVENASILQKMRELHLQLRSLSLKDVTCPDSERYPFLKELIELDKKYHHNWQVYDSYDVNASDAEQTLIEDARMKQKKIYRLINLTKGRYKKNPTAELKNRLVDLYSQLTSPMESLTEELKEMGVI